jgi:hypothetical protein
MPLRQFLPTPRHGQLTLVLVLVPVVDRGDPRVAECPYRLTQRRARDAETEQRPLDDTSVGVLTETSKLGSDLTLQQLVRIFNRKYAVANEVGKAVVDLGNP